MKKIIIILSYLLMSVAINAASHNLLIVNLTDTIVPVFTTDDKDNYTDHSLNPNTHVHLIVPKQFSYKICNRNTKRKYFIGINLTKNSNETFFIFTKDIHTPLPIDLIEKYTEKKCVQSSVQIFYSPNLQQWIENKHTEPLNYL